MNAVVAVQFDLFESREECELRELRKEFEKVKDSATRVRKSQFGEIGKLKKELLELRIEFEQLKQAICTGK